MDHLVVSLYIHIHENCLKLPQLAIYRVVHFDPSKIQLDRIVQGLLTDSRMAIPASYIYRHA